MPAALKIQYGLARWLIKTQIRPPLFLCLLFSWFLRKSSGSFRWKGRRRSRSSRRGLASWWRWHRQCRIGLAFQSPRWWFQCRWLGWILGPIRSMGTWWLGQGACAARIPCPLEHPGWTTSKSLGNSSQCRQYPCRIVRLRQLWFLFAERSWSSRWHHRPCRTRCSEVFIKIFIKLYY